MLLSVTEFRFKDLALRKWNAASRGQRFITGPVARQATQQTDSISHIDEQRSTWASKLLPIGCSSNFSHPVLSKESMRSQSEALPFETCPVMLRGPQASIKVITLINSRRQTCLETPEEVLLYSRVQDIEFHTRKKTINISWCDVLWCKTDCVLPLRNSDFAS